jgi:hypothetical protein
MVPDEERSGNEKGGGSRVSSGPRQSASRYAGGIAKTTVRRIWSGFTLALAVAVAVVFVYWGVTGTISEARSHNWGLMLIEIGVVALFGGMLLAAAIRFVKRNAKPS